jgi:polysaccharide pyruvyl transferase WcaK-like protein
MSIIELSNRLGKEVHYVNSIFADSPYSDRNSEFFKHAVDSLSKCSSIALRDPFSMRLANSEAPHLNLEYVPDSLFHWYDRLQDARMQIPTTGDYTIPFQREETSRFGQLRFDEPYICISGGSRASWYGKNAVSSYARLVDQVKQLGLPVYLTPACSGDEFMYGVASKTGAPVIPAEVPIMMGGAILSEAQLLITGRYHPSILASLGGTPCVFLGADSHKTRSIQEVLQYETKTQFSALPDDQEVEEICELAERYLSRGDSLRSSIRSTAKECAESARRVVDLIE